MTDTVRRHLAWVAGCAAAYVGLSVLVAAGALHGVDAGVARATATIYVPALLPLFRLIAIFGGVEITTVVAVGLFVYLLRSGHRAGSFAAGAFLAAFGIEVLYKKLFSHPGPPRSLSHPDGPSVSDLFSLQLGSSFPSGHVTRSVVVYGLLAFVVNRLAPPGRAQRLAIPLAAALILLMAFDRLYLEVHWESDVLGGLLLGGLALAAGITWLDLQGGVVGE